MVASSLSALSKEIGHANAMIAFFNSGKITFEELTKNFECLSDLIKHSDGELRTRLIDECVGQAGSDTKRWFELYSITSNEPNIFTSRLTEKMALNRCLTSADTLEKTLWIAEHFLCLSICKMALNKSLEIASTWIELMSIYERLQGNILFVDTSDSNLKLLNKTLIKMGKVANTFSKLKWLYERYNEGYGPAEFLYRCLDFQLYKEQLLWVFQQAEKLNNTDIKNKTATRLAQLK